MIKMHRRISTAVVLLTATALILTGCTSEASSISSAKGKTGDAGAVDTGFTLSTVGSYDSADTAVVLSTDETNKAVTFINMETGKQYTLYYDGTTYVQDKYDGPMTISQIKAGDVVDVTFLKGKKQLTSIKLSPQAWVYDDVYNYDLAGANGTASIGSQTYSLPKGVVVLSEGQRVDKAEVVSQDVVSVSGIDHKIYSISVDRGHGYLSLKNEQPLLGGWIEIGNSVIRQITEDMLLVVPEGEYQVALSNNGIGCVKNVTIERNKEVVLDVDDIEIPEDKTGKIIFNVTPDTAKVSVDGEPVDVGRAVELPYGIHRVEATASGYDTLTKYIQVGSEYATISFTLEETRKEDEDRDTVSVNSIEKEETQPFEYEDTYQPASVSANSTSSVSENALRSSKNGTAEVHVKDWTTGAELHGVTVRLEIEDSNKKITSTRSKTSPCSFSKEKDAHVYRFILSMDGYETKTYEPDLEDYQKDETLYFMLKKETPSSGTTPPSKEIPPNIISAVATSGTDCDLTNGTDAYIPPEGNLGNLTDSGKKAVNEAIRAAVQKIVGTNGIGSYYFEVADTLEDVVPLEGGDYEATTSVTVVNKSEYREAAVPVRIIIKKQAEDASLKGQVSFSVTEGAWFTEFTVDGQDISSILEPIELDYGIHTVSIKAVGYEDFTQEFEVNAEELTVSCELVPEGSDEVEVSFWINSGEEFISNVSITIDDEEYTKFPEKLSCGTYNIKVEVEGYKTWEKEITITSNDTSIVIDLEKEEESGFENTDSKEEENNPSSDSETSVTPTLPNPETSVDSTQTESNSSDNLTEETVTINKESHPIRNFFSSLFK